MNLSFKWKPLNLESTTIFKGIAILLIVMHNFINEFPGPKENEFTFDPNNLISMLDILSQHSEYSFQGLLSFLGYFGVQIFIFLSAYGLTKKFLVKKPGYWRYILKRFQTIFPSFILAILLWAVVVGLWKYGLFGPFEILYLNAESLILKLNLLSNFVPGEALKPVGPWWFFAFIFQFYFIFPFLFSLYNRLGNIFLISISVISMILAILFHGEIAGVNLYVNLLGYLPEFCLGIYFAKHDSSGLKIPVIIFLLAILIFTLGSMYETLWHLTHISFLIILIVAFDRLVPVIKKADLSKNIFLFIGSISMSLFLVNGLLRRPFIAFAENYDNWYMTIMACLLFLSVSINIAMALVKVEKVMMSKLQSKKLSPV